MDEREPFEPLRRRSTEPAAERTQPTTTSLTVGHPPQAGLPPARGHSTMVLAAASLISLAVGVAIGWAGFHQDSKTTSTPPASAAAASTSSSATPVTVSGSLTLQRGFLFQNEASTTCEANPSDGFTDISAGTAVTIGDESGKTLVVTQLETGQLVSGDLAGHACQFGFSVQVPGGKTLYTVTISHRGTQTYTPAQVAAGIQMTLG